MYIANIIALVLLVIGGLNWGLIGLTGFNLVSFISGSDRNAFGSIIYVLVFLSAVWLVVSLFLSGGALYFRM